MFFPRQPDPLLRGARQSLSYSLVEWIASPIHPHQPLQLLLVNESSCVAEVNEVVVDVITEDDSEPLELK
jgi:hypothetical protein